jgi:hypothetical protein
MTSRTATWRNEVTYGVHLRDAGEVRFADQRDVATVPATSARHTN